MRQANSYTSEKASPLTLFREARSLYDLHSHGVSARARSSIAMARQIESALEAQLGERLHSKKILDIGPGQFLSHAFYFAVHNNVTAIDLDVIARGFKLADYAKMMRLNGLRRCAKTIVRKLLGVDRRYAAELCHTMGVAKTPSVKVLQMDACSMTFPPEFFDCVYSLAVFHHLPHPKSALDNIVCALRPGGACFITLHLYTSETGCLDPRIFSERANEVEGWRHLRPALQHTVDQPNAFLNRLRLSDWRKLFHSSMPGAHITLGGSGNIERAQKLQSEGELLEYSLEELCNGQLTAVWRKPLH